MDNKNKNKKVDVEKVAKELCNATRRAGEQREARGCARLCTCGSGRDWACCGDTPFCG